MVATWIGIKERWCIHGTPKTVTKKPPGGTGHTCKVCKDIVHKEREQSVLENAQKYQDTPKWQMGFLLTSRYCGSSDTSNALPQFRRLKACEEPGPQLELCSPLCNKGSFGKSASIG